MAQSPSRLPLVALATFLFLFAGLYADLSTMQALVVAILYDIPVALSGLARSRRLTVAAIVMALGASVMAAYANAVAHGSLDDVALLNRGLSALSVVLVGVLTLALRNSAAQVENLRYEGARAEQEHRLRHLVAELSKLNSPEAILARAAPELRALLEAEALAISAFRDETFREPRYVDPQDAALAQPGESASWAFESLPSTRTPVVTLRRTGGPTTIGRWICLGYRDYLVVAENPQVDEASLLLGEALSSLGPLLERSELLEQLSQQVADERAERSP